MLERNGTNGKLLDGPTVRRFVVGLLLLIVGAVGGLFLRVENVNARMGNIERNRFTDRDAARLTETINANTRATAQTLRQEHEADLVGLKDDIKDLRADIRQAITLLRSARQP